MTKFRKGESFAMQRNNVKDAWESEVVIGYFINVNTSDGRPLELFVRKDGNEWQVDCPQCGAAILRGFRTRDYALEGAEKTFEKISKAKYDAFVAKSHEIVAEGSRVTMVRSSDVEVAE